MLVAVYNNGSDTIVFSVDKEGKHVGIDRFFKPGMGRDKEDYDILVGELPLLITTDVNNIFTLDREL